MKRKFDKVYSLFNKYPLKNAQSVGKCISFSLDVLKQEVNVFNFGRL